MDQVVKFGDIISTQADQLSIAAILFNFLICAVMAFVLRKFYMIRSFSLTGKTHIGSVIPILSCVVFLVIVVVKSSLALSLGLVGALSIVRFRTPIKEPEELVYLFLAIAIGLGYGAGHTLVTTIIISLILLMTFFWLSNRNVASNNEYNLVINWNAEGISFKNIEEVVSERSQGMKLVRLDQGKSNNTAVILYVPDEKTGIDNIISELQKVDKDISVTFYEAKTNW
jgi:hypothetical protein